MRLFFTQLLLLTTWLTRYSRIGLIATILVSTVLLNACQSNQTHFNKDKAVKSHINASVAYMKVHDYGNSRRHVLRALELDKNNVQALNLLGLIYQKEDDIVNAEKYFQKAINGSKNVSQARNNYGVMLYQEGRYEEAIQQFKQATIDGSYDRREGSWNNIARCYQKLGRESDAANAWHKALKISTFDANANFGLAHYYYQQGDLKKAQKYYKIFELQKTQNTESALLGLRLAEARNDYTAIKKYRALWQHGTKNASDDN